MNSEQESGIYILELQITDRHIDENNHVNNIEYVKWMQKIAIRHSESRLHPSVLAGHNATWVVRSHHIDYLFPAFPGDIIEIKTWVAQTSNVRSVRKYQFVNKKSGRKLVTAETNWVFIDINSGRPKPIPDDVRNAYIQVLPENEPK